MGASTNWTANDEESGKRRLGIMLENKSGNRDTCRYLDARQKHLRQGMQRYPILSHHFFLKKKKKKKKSRTAHS